MKLVDEDIRKLGGKRVAYGFVVTQQIAGGEDQVIEVKQRCRSLVVPEPVHYRLHEAYEVSKNARRNRLQQPCPCLAGICIVSLGCGIQPVAIGLRESHPLGSFAPFSLFLIGTEAPGSRAKIRVRTRDQQPNEINWCFGGESKSDVLSHLGETRSHRGGFRLIGGGIPHEGGKIICRLPKGAHQRRQGTRLVDGHHASSAEMTQDGMNEIDGFARLPDHHLGEETAAVARQFLAEPGLGRLDKSEIGLVAVHHRSPGIDIGFYWIRLDQTLAEAVNR